MEVIEGKIPVDKGKKVSFILNSVDSQYAMLLAHGAGAGYKHKWMEDMAMKIVESNVSVFRYNLPYMERGGRPGSPREAISGIVSAVNFVRANYKNVNLFAAGKSYGGRMTSHAAAEGLIDDVDGLIFFGFPLHAPGKPSVKRADHLTEIIKPMLFLQGSRDVLADKNYLMPIIDTIKADYYFEDGADHSFKVPKKLGKNQELIINKMANKATNWIKTII